VFSQIPRAAGIGDSRSDDIFKTYRVKTALQGCFDRFVFVRAFGANRPKGKPRSDGVFFDASLSEVG
jgi:hypothetical protein